MPRAQAPRQSYCAQPDCQRERRRLWQQAKRRGDPDYLDNQSQAQRAWAGRNPGYWREYRARHPDYAAQNRRQQKDRNVKRKPLGIARMDVSDGDAHILPDGVYELRIADAAAVAKMGVWTVRLVVVAWQPGETDRAWVDCKERT
ncbi:hypothetical protein [Variovorax rhizosphaerae]|uniref:Uncharacterized protein n=1 Tax=Variovorax rhizosphaerae TaxID=1836200 RepID=A0ABU8X0S3_9BURK